MGTPSTGKFPYASDVGTRSIEGIESLARLSGVPISVSSTVRTDDPGSWHYYQNAVDMVASTASMVVLAAYLYQYSAYLLELIHSGGDGYFVKNGERVSRAYYGDTIVAQHYNHVHCATTMSALQAIASNGADIIPAGAQNVVKTASGCLKPAATTAIITIASIGSIIWTVHPWG